ncbi:hypothetical protein FA15DRAFT_690794 [Coprinopsis marcescibilis]|uniref:Family A G protein-coupled receptor-like protein n=1 Tax=Coprinopsis marcescibilis TaxID=230819 RepID=A0A5C3LBJ3_COPMA|nr:hypothetical protein FA15DRAFT_690794 [Coprinopsis marcescibilis]
MAVTLEEREWAMNALVTTSFTNVAVSLFVAGIQFFMCIYSLYVLIDSPPEIRKGRIPYIVVSFLIFVLYSLAVSLETVNIVGILLASAAGTDAIEIWNSQMNTWLGVLEEVCVTLLIALGDGLLLYRCYIILGETWWLVILPTLTFFAMIGTSIWITTPQGSIQYNIAGEGTRTTLNVVTNVMITAFIAVKLFKAQRRLAKLLPERRGGVYRVVNSILIESALPLSLFGVAHAVVILIELAPDLPDRDFLNIIPAKAVFALLYHTFVALSPQMIIFKVTTGKSWMGTQDSTKDIFSGPIAFAHNTASDRSFNIAQHIQSGSLQSGSESSPIDAEKKPAMV